MKLLFDIGNTRFKWGWWDGALFHYGKATDHGEVDLSALLMNQLKSLPEIQSAWAASVADENFDRELSYIVRKQCGIELNFVRSVAFACGVRNAYAEPERLGVDRFLSLIAVHQHQIAPIVVVSCGTAFTLDAMNAEGVHLGGLILPSPNLMQIALIKRVSRVQLLQPPKWVEIADNTEDALYSGVWLAAVALVEHFVATSTSRFGQTPRLILTGGSANHLYSFLKAKGDIEENLVLRGLLCWILAEK